jgi:NAD(P)-dependent dehydrogenase (short-subunit alcohol dehydrogenase family)
MVSENKYAAVHYDTKGPGDARPTALQIVKDEGLEGKLSNKIVLITGTSAGLGPPTVAAMAATGATIYCAARDLEKARKALAGIEGKLEYLQLDLASLASVKAAAEDFLKRSGGELNILINNAGVMAIPEQTFTADGHEMQFGTNHLGHFLLFQLLKESLLASSTPEFPSRVVNLSSAGHRASGIHFGNFNLDNEYSGWVGYGQAKTANIYMTNSIERRYGRKGLHGLAVHPGGIRTELSRHLPAEQLEGLVSSPGMDVKWKSPEQGAATTILAALGKEYEGRGGIYLEDCGEWGPTKSIAVGMRGHVPHAFDPESEEKLWVESSKLVGVPE